MARAEAGEKTTVDSLAATRAASDVAVTGPDYSPTSFDERKYESNRTVLFFFLDLAVFTILNLIVLQVGLSQISLLERVATTLSGLALWSVNALVWRAYSRYKPERFLLDVVRASGSYIASSLVIQAVRATFDLPLIPLSDHLITLAVGVVSLTVLRALFQMYTRSRQLAFTRRALIVGTGPLAGLTAIKLNKRPHLGGDDTEFVGCVSAEALAPMSSNGTDPGPIVPVCSIDELPEVIEKQGITDVVIAVEEVDETLLPQILHRVSLLPVYIHYVPEYYESLVQHLRDTTEGEFHDDVLDSAMIEFTENDAAAKIIQIIPLRNRAMSRRQYVVKRLFDVIVAGALLLAVLPVLAVVALLIWLDDRGPVLYIHKRVGENGHVFNMYKFRTMVVNADKLQAQINQRDEEGNLIHKTRHDPRVTRVGRFIRRTSIDELPQLFNVVRGDMSLVGPRPELPWVVQEYKLWQFKRLSVPQGITGWWQVTGRSDKPMHLNTAEDVYYIENYSWALDAKILLRTFRAVLDKTGAF